MKKLFTMAAMLSGLLFFVSCDEEEPEIIVIEEPEGNELISGLITEDLSLSADKLYELAGRVIVTNGATLSIEAGTIIKGRAGEGTNASVLMIARDGKIDAVGTASSPIIFTSVDDNIEIGQTSGSNLSATDRQLWGGLVILGNAPISVEAGTSAQIEGVPASEPLGQYGGSNNDDNRGNLKYISIRHGGTTIDAVKGNDINGLTLAGVGAGTIIENVEIFANFDDGIEFFGGSVSIKNALVYTVGDDAIDIDQAYSGTVDNFWVFTSTAAASDEGLEIDGPEGPENAEGKYTLINGTITSIDGGGSAADFKSKPQGSITNVKWTGFTGGATLKFRQSYADEVDCATKIDAQSNLMDDVLTFTTVEFGSISIYANSEVCAVSAADQAAAEAKIANETATGAGDASIWSGWTAIDGAGLL